MVEPNLHDSSPDSLSRSILAGSAEALSQIKDITEQELGVLELWCANLPIDSDVRSRLSSAISQVSCLRLGK